VGTGSDQNQLVVVITADRGLAGGFNSGVARAAREHIFKLIRDGKDVQIICIGRKGRVEIRQDGEGVWIGGATFTGVRGEVEL